MKRKSFVIGLMLAAVIPAKAIGLAKMCSNIEGVTTITITKQMMGFLSQMPTEMVDFEALADKLNQVEFVTVTDEDKLKEVEARVLNYLGSHRYYEEMLSFRDGTEKINLYAWKAPSGENEYLILIIEPYEVTAVLLQGTLTPEDVGKFTDISSNM
ncbi:MAG: DUF4252 domain-containing protein [Bacteroidales bacterium]|nr:DUF4252 domain-containing protein [Bacteroidales bacterium]